jgi:hypothetical protein
LAGCGASTSVKFVGNGYEEVTRTHRNVSEPDSHQTGLQYRKPNGERVMIWPSVKGYINKDTAMLFIGDKASQRRDLDNRPVTEDRLFAVKASGPVLDITDEVLWRWSKESGRLSRRFRKHPLLCFQKKKAM